MFVDYEHWYISLDKKYHIKPDIRAWYDDMSETLDVQEVYFFADFTKGNLREEKAKIRLFTNKIIETGSMTTYVQKDFTDFIMLDQIYQEAMSRQKENDVFVIFTGDGHFYSVVSFLKNICKKTVGIYAVHGALSTQLKLTASWVKEVPNDRDKMKPYFQKILTFLSETESDSSALTPTFLYTVEQVKTRYESDEEETREALQYLVDNGYVRRGSEQRSGRTVTVVSADWHAVLKDDLWLPEKGDRVPSSRTSRPVQPRTVTEKQEQTPKKADTPTEKRKSEPKPSAEKVVKNKPKQPSATKAAQPAAPKNESPKKASFRSKAQDEDLTPVKLPRRLQAAVPVAAEPTSENKPKKKRRRKSSKPKTEATPVASKPIEKTETAEIQPTVKKKRRRRKPAHKPTEQKETT